jgi:hypothetical protein
MERINQYLIFFVGKMSFWDSLSMLPSDMCVKQRCVLLLVAPDSQLSLPAIFI